MVITLALAIGCAASVKWCLIFFIDSTENENERVRREGSNIPTHKFTDSFDNCKTQTPLVAQMMRCGSFTVVGKGKSVTTASVEAAT